MDTFKKDGVLMFPEHNATSCESWYLIMSEQKVISDPTADLIGA